MQPINPMSFLPDRDERAAAAHRKAQEVVSGAMNLIEKAQLDISGMDERLARAFDDLALLRRDLLQGELRQEPEDAPTEEEIRRVAAALAPEYPGASEDDYYREEAERAIRALRRLPLNERHAELPGPHTWQEAPTQELRTITPQEEAPTEVLSAEAIRQARADRVPTPPHQSLVVRPGDVLVIAYPEGYPAEKAAADLSWLRRRLPEGAAAHMLVGAQLSVIRSSAEE